VLARREAAVNAFALRLPLTLTAAGKKEFSWSGGHLLFVVSVLLAIRLMVLKSDFSSKESFQSEIFFTSFILFALCQRIPKRLSCS